MPCMDGIYGGLHWPLAVESREPGQAWKGAAAATYLGAETGWCESPPIFPLSLVR